MTLVLLNAAWIAFLLAVLPPWPERQRFPGKGARS